MSKTLEEQQRLDFIAALEDDDRIYSVSFCPTGCHPMLVKYDRDHYSSQDVLASIESQKVNQSWLDPFRLLP